MGDPSPGGMMLRLLLVGQVVGVGDWLATAMADERRPCDEASN